MGRIGTSAVSIRFFGDDLDPSEITRVLGCDPSTTYRTGDRRTTAGREYEQKYGAWIVAAEDRAPESIDEQLSALFARMTQDLPTWLALVARYEADVLCGLFMDQTNEGFSLSTATLRALASRGLEIGFDVYSPTEEHVSEGRSASATQSPWPQSPE